MMPSQVSRKIAVVTGAAGYVATHVVNALVERGYYEIRATVRARSSSKELQQAFPFIKIYEADLLTEGSFDEAFRGATVVFHTASPVAMGKVSDPKAELIDPALQGTLNVLRSVEKAGTVRRVVLTSSLVAMQDIQQPDPNHVYSEADWNMTSTLETSAYALGKTLAEKAAWDFVKGKQFDLVVVNPALVFGPVLTTRDISTSVALIQGALAGKFVESGLPPFNLGITDARDLGELHVRLAENPRSNGRHLLSTESSVPLLELIEILRKSDKYSSYRLPTAYAGPVPPTVHHDSGKVKREHGIVPRLLEQTVLDTAESLVRWGLVPALQAAGDSRQ